ncbi:(d)CMP kinase [Caulobacter mirabilis]|uniref:Cytidylate kinase n=1 Tax=Caulobacter mirabilis TaxID=69666 RepID=A0A2D2B3H5_9CAUL|nr:(d)CMP kinase [Caulobacter mirabilis]ATQ44774.1 cytidylate kinase [Caulobacter mirabilis]
MGFVIAVDGPAASGKGTIAVKLGALYGFPVLDTGLLYRAVGVKVLESGGDLGDEAAAVAAAKALDPQELERPEVRTRAAGEAASRVAIYTPVRQVLRDFQLAFAAQEPGAVLDGRDIGTVIAPRAPAKLYVTASPEVRAERRWKQLTGQGETVAYEDILADIRIRDERDGARAESPMRPADDAVLLDTTEMSIDAAFDAARRIVEAARSRWETAKG